MKPNPIVVRPRKGSDLEQVWEENGRNAAVMREYFHSWAQQFKTNNATPEGERE